MMTVQEQQAAVLVAEGHLKLPAISRETEIPLRSLVRLKHENQEFREAVANYRKKALAEIPQTGLAVMANRLHHKMVRHAMLRRIVARRRHDPYILAYLGVLKRDPETGEIIEDPTLRHPPEAGLMVVKWKGKDADRPEFAVDTGILSEFNQLEQDIAIELGQWKQKHELTDDTLDAMAKSLAQALGPRQLRQVERWMLASGSVVDTTAVADTEDEEEPDPPEKPPSE